jgi:thioredoxin 1
MIEYNNTNKELQQTLDSHEYVLCNFTATWCGPCRGMAPIVERLAVEHPKIKFVKVDVDENPHSSEMYGIRAMPTFMLFQNGAKIQEFMGANPSSLSRMVRSVA